MVMKKENSTQREAAMPMKRIGCMGMARNDSNAANVVSALKSTGHPISPMVSSTAKHRCPCVRNLRLKKEYT